MAEILIKNKNKYDENANFENESSLHFKMVGCVLRFIMAEDVVNNTHNFGK